ncbi:MAG: hypothetical protein Q7O66_19840 [Dehalococcoidia bacterium]|nr:hypothetical protein [Dehalococcoidia bacterium]
MNKPKIPRCRYCGWYGSDDDPIMRFFDHEQPYCLLGTSCRERQERNRNRQSPPEEITVEVGGQTITRRYGE